MAHDQKNGQQVSQYGERLQKAREKFQELDRKRVQAEADLRSAQEEERRAREEAEQAYGTSDPDALQRMADEAEDANRRAIEAFETKLAEAERALANLEQQERAGE